MFFDLIGDFFFFGSAFKRIFDIFPPNSGTNVHFMASFSKI